jgi:hypothetical protein
VLPARLAGLVGIAAALVWVPTVDAAVVTGSATDPAADLASTTNLPSPAIDFTSVAVTYDSAGRVDTTFGFPAPPPLDLNMRAAVGLGTVRADGSCTAPTFPGGNLFTTPTAQFQALVSSEGRAGDAYTVGVVWEEGSSAEGWTDPTGAEFADSNRTWRFHTTHVRLANKHYTCARAGLDVWRAEEPVGSGTGYDVLDTDVFALTEPPPPPPAPSVTWVSPLNGQTISGVLSESGAGAQRCLVDGVGPIVRTVNYVDGNVLDTQLFSPWGCELDTRLLTNGSHVLTVKAFDASDKQIASDSVQVIVNNPDPPPTLRLTGGKARAAAKTTLTRRYGRAFRKRRAYRANCSRVSATRWTCTVRWRFGPFVYKGRVRLRLRFDGDIASQLVIRRITK